MFYINFNYIIIKNTILKSKQNSIDLINFVLNKETTNMQVEEKFNKFSDTMKDFKLPHWEDLPDIDLYMDQVISLMEKYLTYVAGESSKTLTSSMINNYVKLGIIPAPTKKRYSREHLAYLLIICSLKQIMPIPKIKEIIDIKLQSNTIAEILNYYSDLYNHTFDEVLTTINKFIKESNTSSNIYNDAAIFSAIVSSRCSHLSQEILKMELPESINTPVKKKSKKQK